jgi:hypothetical protein
MVLGQPANGEFLASLHSSVFASGCPWNNMINHFGYYVSFTNFLLSSSGVDNDVLYH